MPQTLNDEEIQRLDEEHGGVAAVHTVKGTVVFRKAKRIEMQRFHASILGDEENKKATAAYVLTVGTVVYPSQEEFKKLVESATALPTACLKPIMKLNGSEVEEHEKKSEA